MWGDAKRAMALVAQRLFGVPTSLLNDTAGHDVTNIDGVEDAQELQPQDQVEEEAADASVSLADFHALQLKDLRALAKHVGVAATGGKALLVERITAAEAPAQLPDKWSHLAPWWSDIVNE